MRRLGDLPDLSLRVVKLHIGFFRRIAAYKFCRNDMILEQTSVSHVAASELTHRRPLFRYAQSEQPLKPGSISRSASQSWTEDPNHGRDQKLPSKRVPCKLYDNHSRSALEIRMQ